MSLHPSQFEYHSRVQFQSGVASWLMVLTGWGLLTLACFLRQPALKAASFGGVLLVGCAARPVRKIAIGTERLSNDVADLSHTSTQRWLFEEMKPTVGAMVQTTPVNLGDATISPITYDWRLLNREPHIFLLGGTGDGKTTLCRWLLTQLQGAHLALDPHAAPGKWAGLPTIGQGRDFSGISEALIAIYNLMLQRFDELAQGVESFPILNIVIDEFPAIAGKGTESSDVAKQVIPQLLRESRKVGIRLIVLAQGSEVKTLGCEGEGSLRDQLHYVRLGKFAKQHAKHFPELQHLIQGMQRPCMVEDVAAIVPDLAGFKPTYRTATLPEGFRQLIGKPDRHQLMGSTTTGPIPAYSPSNVVHFSPRNRETTSRNGAETRQKQQLRPTYPDTEMISDSAPTTPISDHDRAKRVREMKAAGLSQTQILKIEWGVSPGSSPRYTQAVLEYRAIVGDATE